MCAQPTVCNPTDCRPPAFLGFSRQEYWNGFSFHPSGDLPDPGIKSMSSELASRFFTTEPPGKPKVTLIPDMNLILSIYEPKMYSGQCLICFSIYVSA